MSDDRETRREQFGTRQPYGERGRQILFVARPLGDNTWQQETLIEEKTGGPIHRIARTFQRIQGYQLSMSRKLPMGRTSTPETREAFNAAWERAVTAQE